ncbi:20386_t:CDS:2, partial [Gigaspora margarita]
EICIIRQLLENYPKISEKQLKEIQEKDTTRQSDGESQMEKRQRKIDTLILTECKTNPISEDTGRHTRPIVTNNKDRNAKEGIELEESYMLWDLPLNFNNTQVKLLIKLYGKVSSINWIFDSFKKRAIVKIAIKNKRSKQILDDLWSLSIGRKLTRIIQGENEEEVLVNRGKHRLILEGINRNTVEVLLFWQLKQVKPKSAYIPINSNLNPRGSAFVYFEKEEDMYKAINIKINYGNTFLFWRDISEVERPDRRSTSAVKWNWRNLLPDSDKRKKVVNGFSKNALKLNQKNTLYEKKITCSHNKENVSGKTTKYKNHYDEDKRKKDYNVERLRYIKGLDEKLQIILQRLDKIEANRSRDGDKSTWKEIGAPNRF